LAKEEKKKSSTSEGGKLDHLKDQEKEKTFNLFKRRIVVPYKEREKGRKKKGKGRWEGEEKAFFFPKKKGGVKNTATRAKKGKM